jgi:Flp pilus assembly protein TadD
MVGWAAHNAQAGDLKIPLPQRSKLTPVQKLNREGVDAVRKHHYDRARTLFYRAYLFDPDDPFTLNNLGYISELEGNAESARRFYSLAQQESSSAIIDKASSPQARGKTVRTILASTGDFTQTNVANRESIRLMSQGRSSEAQAVLQRALAANPRNAFTLNNIGVVSEMQGDLEKASKYYSDAAVAPQSGEPVIIASDNGWRGRPISQMASANARRVQERLQTENKETSAARVSLRGVAALNRNDPEDARKFFERAYTLDKNYSFALNNLGYLAEMNGDYETAQWYYEKARAGARRDRPAGLTTRSSAEGMKLAQIATDNNLKVNARITAEHNARRQQRGPIELRPRTPASTSEQKPATSQTPGSEQ